MISTVVGPVPVHSPPSNTRSTRQSKVANSSIPLERVGWPEMFALVAISACPICSIIAVKVFELGWRMASRPVLPVTFSGTLAAAGTIIVSGPGQKWRARI